MSETSDAFLLSLKSISFLILSNDILKPPYTYYRQNIRIDCSAPTASRDLKWAVENEILNKSGEQGLTEYQFN
ncbi:hypothetical protein J2W57_001865 [Chryseobacterium ginsenosidimutans]|uniref:Uncharacterized protein n=1 Tax=Chryseobacterium geocarposphaerae TaxID=1416776 RepID=A0ABU1LB89_9FLAO|nr:hypothetical protein [Chryseobacterium geocarposphaerae]MDR6698493.1 hypothetical protein [Chryseobacterium ginsenosidimutans]